MQNFLNISDKPINLCWNIYDFAIDSRKLKYTLYTYLSWQKAQTRVKNAESQRNATLILHSVREGSLMQLIIS